MPLVLSLSAAAMHAGAQTPASLGPVVVTALREPQPLDRVIGDLVVIDAMRIRDSGADGVEDLLRRVGGIELSRNGGPGQIAGLQMRGHSSANTVVLIDGVRVGSATSGQMDLSSLSLATIERIEVLRGPVSSLYGADAVGGVVQIITRRGKGEPTVAAHASAGELRSSDVGASVRGADAGVDYALSASREHSDGVSAIRAGDAVGLANPDRDGFTREAVSARVGLAIPAGHRLGLNAQRHRLRSAYDSAEFLPPTFAADPNHDFRSRLVTDLVAADWRGELNAALTMSLLLSQQHDELETGAVTIARFQTRRRQATWQNALRFGSDQTLVAALERLQERVETTSYAAPERRTDSIVLAWSGRFDAHRLQLDVRHDDNSVYGAVTTGKLGWSVDLAPRWRARIGAGNAFRGPSFNDLYFPGFGVTTLQPEKSTTLEVALQWNDADTRLAATAYRTRVRDLIGFEPDRSFCPSDPSYDFGCARNIDRARLRGLTLDGEHRLDGAWTVRATIDLLDAKNSATGERLPRRAAHHETLGVAWSGGDWSAGATLLSVGQRPEGGVQLDAYQLLDLQARYRFAPQWRVEAKLLNAFDRSYQPARDYQAPGRQAWLGIRYDGAGL